MRQGSRKLRRHLVAQGAVRPVQIVQHAMSLGQNPRLGQACKELLVEQFVPKPAAERLDVPVLSGASRFDVLRLHPCARQPLPQGLGHEFRTVVHRE